jgi:murein L,D-transpeptidase YcbB/YkuD
MKAKPHSLPRWSLTCLVVSLACGRVESKGASASQSNPLVSSGQGAEVSAALSAFLASPEAASETPADRESLAAVYAEPVPIWVDSAFHATKNAKDAVEVLKDAAAEGLDPEDYGAAALETQAQTLASGKAEPASVAAFDVTLSRGLLRYLRHFHRGRVNPRDFGFQMTLPEDPHDYVALVRAAAAEGNVREVVASVQPPLVQYRALRSMLPKYRALALVDGTTLPKLPPAPKVAVKPGGTTAGLDILRTRLIAIGDLPENAGPVDPHRYEGQIVEGVKHFQTRHGYEGDGVLGKTTWAALSVPLSWRLRQIELAMERMRWLPHLGERAFVAVNIPMFHLWGWNSVPETGAPDFGMGVIVGKALDTKTPVFLDEMKYVIFQPYWNVPKSILIDEILPLMKRKPDYLASQGMEIVDGQSDEAKPVAADEDNIELLAKGKLRLRQRPGPKNALGQVKFMFPNDENVYLHSTPAPELFGRARRDFSHGCVRVEDPVKLAEWALKDQPEWTREKIIAAMNGKPSQRVQLTRPIRVVMYYVTATVIPDENAIHFADDIYSHDPPLDRALAGSAPKPR